eukprot:2107846-Prymnesium_polylepis.1
MQHHWFNGHRPSQVPWPAIECYNRTTSERIRFAFPNCSNVNTLCINPVHHDSTQSTCVPAYIAILFGDGKQMQSLHLLCTPRCDVHHFAPEEHMPVVTPSCGTHWQSLALIGTHWHITIVDDIT